MQKFTLDIRENNMTNRVVRLILGTLSLIVAVWLAVKLRNTTAFTLNTTIAITFLAGFGLWELFSGFGYSERYIIISDDKIILKHRFYLRAKTIGSGDLEKLEFKPLEIVFHMREGNKVSIRLGMYYSEHSTRLMEAVEAFASVNKISTSGL